MECMEEEKPTPISRSGLVCVIRPAEQVEDPPMPWFGRSASREAGFQNEPPGHSLELPTNRVQVGSQLRCRGANCSHAPIWMRCPMTGTATNSSTVH